MAVVRKAKKKTAGKKVTTESKAKSDSERKAFKDWFDKSAAAAMADQICAVHKEFDKASFRRRALKKIEVLEFNDRVKQFSDALHQTLPASYPEAIGILVASLPEEVDAASVTDGYLQWPIGQFIADYGTDHFKQSIVAMTELTQRFSSEFAVRPYVEKYPDQTLAYLQKQTSHPSEHVRRWCSEGTRTRLPWGNKLNDLIAEPEPVFPILEALLDDESLYVRKSVANNLNDLSKDHPQLVINKCRGWKRKNSPHRDWIIKQGLRGLIKLGDPAALELTGFGTPEKVKVALEVSPSVIKVGQTVTMKAVIGNNSKKNQSLMIDYVVHYVRKNSVVNEKVFKWKTVDIEAGGTITVKKSHPMKETTIRALYKGRHKLEVQVNGVRLASGSFTLK